MQNELATKTPRHEDRKQMTAGKRRKKLTAKRYRRHKEKLDTNLFNSGERRDRREFLDRITGLTQIPAHSASLRAGSARAQVLFLAGFGVFVRIFARCKHLQKLRPQSPGSVEAGPHLWSWQKGGQLIIDYWLLIIWGFVGVFNWLLIIWDLEGKMKWEIWVFFRRGFHRLRWEISKL